MLASAFLLLLNGAFLSLRLGAGSGSFPRPLPAKEERRCVERWMQGDLEARNTLIEHNLRLVAHIIKKYYTSESEQDDLISIGTVGLIKGVSTYRPDKGVRLATYASRCIENEVLMHFRGSRKSAGDLSLSDSIDTDSDGNSLRSLSASVAADRQRARRARGRDPPPSLRAERRRRAHAARDRQALQHFPLLCIAAGEKGARKTQKKTGRGII